MLNERWQRNLLAVWLGQTMTASAFSFVFPFMPLYVQELGVRGTAEAAQWAAALATSAAITMTIFQPIWGTLSDRWGRKPMIIRSMIGGGLTIGAMAFVSAPEQLLALRLIQGSVTGVIAAANALVATSTPKHRLGFALGLLQVAMFTGSSVGPLLGGVLADRFGYRLAFLGAGGMLLAGGFMVYLAVKEEFTPSASTVGAKINFFTSNWTLLAVAFLPMILGVNFLIHLGGVIVGPILSLYIAELSGGDNVATTAGLVLAATGAASAASAVVIGRTSDRLGPHLILPVCLAGAALFYLPQAFVQNVWQLTLLRIGLGACLGGMMPAASAMVAHIVPEGRRGGAYGLLAMSNSASNVVGPPIAAVIATHWGMRDVFVFTGALFTVVFWWVALMFRTRRVPGSTA